MTEPGAAPEPRPQPSQHQPSQPPWPQTPGPAQPPGVPDGQAQAREQPAPQYQHEIVPAGPPQPPAHVMPKNPLLYLVVSLFIPGVGTMAAGRVGWGVLILASYIVAGLLTLVLVGFVLVPAVWIWGMVDAYQTAKKWNAAHGIVS
jgi:TM2 domain-containing membrane protein YozV